MKAVWYSQNGPAQEVLMVGELPTPEAGPGEVRVRLHTSGVNPSDVKSRRARPLTDALIVPHSDGAGVIDQVGEGVDLSRLGQRVWTGTRSGSVPWGRRPNTWYCLSSRRCDCPRTPTLLRVPASASLR